MKSMATTRSGRQGRRTAGLLLASLLLLISQTFYTDFASAATPTPACCRAHGRHAAGMKGDCSGQPANRSGFSTVHEKCPYVPLVTSAVGGSVFALSVKVGRASLADAGQPESSLPGSAAFSQFESSNRKRGPPAPLHS
jgi:hypothetical protein